MPGPRDRDTFTSFRPPPAWPGPGSRARAWARAGSGWRGSYW